METVTAPLLGVFWRRPTPDQPTYVEEGDTIESGQTVGLIEVMKSFHEVTATQPGVVRRILVDDGATVEYGQPLMELASPEDG
jgi:acetyl-CoA carboxylase biotin carboxyl carrier protein